MNNAEDFQRDTVMDPVNQQGQEIDPSNSNSYAEEGISMATGDESFLLEDDQSQDFIDNQRTSTPTKTFTRFAEDGVNLDDPTQGSALSPVLRSDAAENTTSTHDQQSSSHDQSSLSPGRNSTWENSGEESWSLYTSAFSNVNTTLTPDTSYSAVKDQPVESSALQFSMPEDTLCQESLGEFSSEDNTWATACGSLQDDSDLKDVTMKQELSHSNLSSNVDDSNHEDNGESTYEDMDSAVEEVQDSQDIQNSDTEDVKTETDRDVISVEVPPDLDLLNEICEEATNMTIKEALICSLNPGVRAGLREGRLSLNESEILALEQYCEQFIDNLISQLLDGHWSERISEEKSKSKPLEDKAKVAQKLSELGLETLKSNCDRFVHSVITESLHDSCFRFQSKSAKSPESNKELNKQIPNVALDQNSVEILLPLFKESEAIQDYIGFLAADVIKSALANLSTAIATKNGDKNDHMMMNKNSTSDNKTSTERILSLSEQKKETQLDPIPDNDMWKSESDGLRNEAKRIKRSSLSSDEDFEGQYAREAEGLSDDEHMLSSCLNGALETSLEFDIGDCWEGGGLLEDLNTLDAERKQKIVLRELSFDEHADVAGTELLAPVFLAIAEENDDDTEFQGMRKKAQSIENLCGIIDEHVDERFRQRSYSAPKRIKLLHQTAQTHFINPEQDNGEMKPNDKQYEEDDFENEIVDEEEWDGDKDEEDEENEEEQNGYVQDEEEQDHEGQDEKFGQDGQEHDKTEVSSDSGRFRWHTVSVNGRDKILDLKLLEPYMKVISHGGYFSDTKATIVVIAACYLPDRSMKNYDFLMEQLFFYVISTLELLAIHEDYYLVYLNGGTRQQNTPSVTWMKRFYQYIEGGLKKRMKEMFIVHPSFRLKAVITLAKPFLNASFWRKLSFVHSLSSLSSHVPVDYIYIPDEVTRADPAYRQVHGP